MVICSKAPFRIGLAGGGTDVSPFCDLFGGAIVNTTISLFAHARIEVRGEQIIIKATDRNERQVFDLSENLPINGVLDLHKAVYNRLQKDYDLPVRGFHITTATDAPAGSGLGTSSTLVVSILGAFLKMYEMEMRPHAVAQYAYNIERIDLGFSGGRQDQFAASFGGFNFMSFEADNRASIVPIKLKEDYKNLLQKNLLLYFTNSSRNSASIIDEQVENVVNKHESSISAMHYLKKQALIMQEMMHVGQPDELGSLLDFGFRQKKNMARHITNERIDILYKAALDAGATGGKISGAGGGGFMVFYCPGITRENVVNALLPFGGAVKEFVFVSQGLTTWKEN